jgi:hypothetical protein
MTAYKAKGGAVDCERSLCIPLIVWSATLKKAALGQIEKDRHARGTAGQPPTTEVFLETRQSRSVPIADIWRTSPNHRSRALAIIKSE